MAQRKSRSSWIGESISNRYTIEAELGQGGMSAVYKANDPNLQRTVAIKLIHPHLSSDAEFVRRFEQEAAAVAQLRHPNIIQVFDFNHDEDLYYMVLEFIPGDTLQAKVKALDKAGQKLSLAETVDIIAPMCDAVGYAHEQGMIHRDLKPANIMINPKGQSILMDFGVAKMLSGVQHTATGAIIGTAKYMSPEQARGGRPDERTDVYSLGVILFEMLAGEAPFDADSTVALLMKHVIEPIPDIRTLNQDIPEPLVKVVKKSLAKDKTERYQSAVEMAAALRASLLSQTPVADYEATTLQSTSTGETAFTSTPPSVSSTTTPVTEAVKKGGIPTWVIGVSGAIALVVILILAIGAFFIFSSSDDTPADEVIETDTTTIVSTAGQQSTLPSSENMVRVPGDSYSVGVEVSGENYAPMQQIELTEFWIDRYEVSNNQYTQFIADTGYEPPTHWSGTTPPADEEDHPVNHIAWDAAATYCTWINKRLPTEAEWEVAARGSEGRLFPWGNNPNVVPLPQGGTYPTGSKPTNQSPFGVFDIAGNVWEWVDDPYNPIEQGNRVLKGGANGLIQNMAYRLQGDPNTTTMTDAAGIRCAANAVEVQPIASLAEDVLATDDFTNSGSGWPILTEGEHLYGYHPPDFYHVQVSVAENHTSVSRDPALTDFTVEANVQVLNAQTEEGNFRYGLAFRRVADEQYYAFTISPRAGMWYILKSSAAGFEVLNEGSSDSLRGIAPQGFTPDSNQVDILRVDAKADNFILHINGQPVAHFKDKDYANGEIGFFVENFDETRSHIHYDLFTIREVDFDEATAVALAPPPPTEEPTTTEETRPTAETIPSTETIPSAETPPTAEPEATSEEISPTPTEEAISPPPTPEPAPPSSNRDNMILIPAGYFLMGSSTGQADETPEHPVLLDTFYIDKYEVSNDEYRNCINQGGCTQANTGDSFTYSGYRDSPIYNEYPVVSVNWDQANNYCRWAGKRLPTEAEWEYAASGSENLTWPWGNTFEVNLSAANAPDTQSVGSYPAGVSPLGVHDMAGNVSEWVDDSFDSAFYANSPPRNPNNFANGDARIYRGGSFGNPDGAFFTTSRRYGNNRSFSDVDVGFRCVAIDPNAAQTDPALITEFCEVFTASRPDAPCP